MNPTNGPDPIEEIKETLVSQTGAPFEIFYLKNNNEVIEAKDENIDGYETATTEGVAIRVLDNQRMGFGFTTRLDSEGIRHMVRQTLESLKVSPEDPAYHFLDPSVPYPTLNLRDPTLQTLTAGEKSDWVLSIERAARESDPRIKKVRNAQFSIRDVSIRIYNSLGLDRSYSATGVSANIMLTAEDNGSSEYGWESASHHFLSHIHPEEIGKRAAEKAIRRLGGKPVPSGQVTAILDREVVAEIVGLLASSFSGENVYKGKSTLANKVGKAVFSRHLTLYDGLLFEEGMAAAPFDGEGEPGRKTLLIDKGVVVGFLYDHYYGRKAGQPSTANSVRAGVSAPPICGPTNLAVVPGADSFEELLSGISKGFFIQELMGVHTANPITGDFSLGASGQWIENGKCTVPVRGVAVSGNLFDMLNRIEAVSREIRWFGTIGAPYLLIGSVTVAGT